MFLMEIHRENPEFTSYKSNSVYKVNEPVLPQWAAGFTATKILWHILTL